MKKGFTLNTHQFGIQNPFGDQWWTVSLWAGQAIGPTWGLGAKRRGLMSESFLLLLADPDLLFPLGHAMGQFRSSAVQCCGFTVKLFFFFLPPLKLPILQTLQIKACKLRMVGSGSSFLLHARKKLSASWVSSKVVQKKDTLL